MTEITENEMFDRHLSRNCLHVYFSSHISVFHHADMCCARHFVQPKLFKTNTCICLATFPDLTALSKSKHVFISPFDMKDLPLK